MWVSENPEFDADFKTSQLFTLLDLILTRLDLILTWPDLILT